MAMSPPDFTVIGGGISGLLTALMLHDGGATVEVLERGPVGTESSWAGGGILSPLYPWRYPEPVTRLARWGQERYPGFLAGLARDSGHDPEYRPSGLLVLGEEEVAPALAWAEAHGAEVAVVDASQARDLEPALDGSAAPGVWLPAVGQVRNPRLVRALRGALQARGVPVHEQAAVAGLEVDAGRVIGIVRGDGVAPARRVVVAAGAWSAQLLEPLVAIPVRPIRGQMVLFHGAPDLLHRIVLARGRYLIPRRDGRILAGSTLEDVGFDKTTTTAAREDLTGAARALVPALNDLEVEHHWAGLRPGSPDGVPYIGPIPGVDGLFVNVGHYRNGVVLGLAAARLAADLALGGDPILDPNPYACATPRPGDYGL